jgi:hypothetical protein
MTRTSRILLLALAMLALAVPASALAAGKPTAKTSAATLLAPDAATVNGSLNPSGLVTTWYFQFGKTGRYGSRTPAQDAGSGTKSVKVSSGLTGLTPNTTYHFRLTATNSAGSTSSADRTFKTPQTPTVSTIATSANPAHFGQAVAIGGFLVGPNGGGGKQVALEGNAFPYLGGFTQIGNAVVTAPNGGYQFVFTPIIATQLRVVDQTNPSVVSPVVTQTVALHVTLHPSHRNRKGQVRFAGTVTPAGSTSVVVIQRRTSKGGWKNVAHPLPHTKSGATASTYRSGKVKVRPGVFRAVASPSSGGYVEGTSNGKRVKR